MQRFGVIDLGTNTFHLLIVEYNSDGTFKELYRERRFVKLAEDGIEAIGDAPFCRGVHTMIDYKNRLEEWKVATVKAFGTAALRRAKNGQDFIKTVQIKSGIDIRLISGEEEARLIYLGVQIAVPFEATPHIIMDIGGGSVEFIIADKSKVHWAQSFPVGVAILYKNFHQREPISSQSIHALNAFLETELEPLLQILPNYKFHSLVGASGAFEVIEKMLPIVSVQAHHCIVNAIDFHPLFQKIIPANLEERLQMEGMPATRADLIVVAFLLIQFLLKRVSFQSIIVSNFAMKEGILQEMFLENQ